MSTEGRSIFITGAASGIGRATARLFAEKGWIIGAADINKEGLDLLLRELGKDSCSVYELDVTDRSEYGEVMDDFSTRTDGKLDILYNNAGTCALGLFEDIPYEKALEIIHVNLIGTVNGIYAALPLLKATQNALCFTTSSSSGTYGAPGMAIYACTKHAVKGITEALSVEFRQFNIRAADVLPGFIDTNLIATVPTYKMGREVPKESPFQDSAPSEGLFQLVQPEAVAEIVWKAYHSDQLHWYVPEDWREVDRLKGESPEKARADVEAGIIFPDISNSDSSSQISFEKFGVPKKS